MSAQINCPQNIDPLKLVRAGTSQDQRVSAALDPAYAPVDEHAVAERIVFAQNYAALLKYFDANNLATGDWTPFFAKDVAAQLAMLAVENIEAYKAMVKSFFDVLNDPHKQTGADQELKDHLGLLFHSLATLAQRLDGFEQALAEDVALKATLQNLIKTQLLAALKRLVAYYNAGLKRNLINPSIVKPPELLILGKPIVSFATVLDAGLLADWGEGLAWDKIPEADSVYGDIVTSPFVQINYCANHYLFKSIFDQFLKVYARVVAEAALALQGSLTRQDNHEPHYALFLSFLRLFEYARQQANGLTQRHLDFYYRDILRLKEKQAEPGHVHLLLELAKHQPSHELKSGELFKAGKDADGKAAFFANDRTFVANQAKVVALKMVYRHGDEPVVINQKPSDIHQGRVFAAPIANSADGLGAELTTPDQSWHPFSNKIYRNGQLSEIHMPEAELGFAIASHYLLLAEGSRTITLSFDVTAGFSAFGEHNEDLLCLLTSKNGWFSVNSNKIRFSSDAAAKTLRLTIALSGADPAITPYVAQTHAYDFATDLPLLLVKLKHRSDAKFIYNLLQPIGIKAIHLTVDVKGLKTLAVSNDFGPVDTALPFQPYGAQPRAGANLIIGAKEVFQKSLDTVSINLSWQTSPVPYKTSPQLESHTLANGLWNASSLKPADVTTVTSISLPAKDLQATSVNAPDFSASSFYGTEARYGFVRLQLNAGFGFAKYQEDLIKYLLSKAEADKPANIPVAPSIAALSLDYVARTTLQLDSAAVGAYANRSGRFFHLAPFGQAEQHPYLNPTIGLLPQWDFLQNDTSKASEAECYIGISDLQPAQNLALLFQVADGSADPLAVKPKPHVHWSYLKDNRWLSFASNDVSDATGEWLNSGILSLAIPREISNNNSLFPAGLCWIRAAVHEKSDAVCRLRMVAAQALKASFSDQGNAAQFSATPLAAETISKLDQPDAAIKSISQPFPSFGGRGTELPEAFYRRSSERLRHKDRAITLWDYEYLVLEAFPQIYRVKCLNHTWYESDATGEGVYRELAPGHITLVTIPNQTLHNQHDPLKPYTSLGLLDQIESFLRPRVSGFARLHVMNPLFEAVRVEFSLRLYSGFDESYYVKELQQAITRFLSPWAFNQGGSASFGGKIYKSVLINFIEDQPYVDYVSHVQLFHDIDSQAGSIDQDEVSGSKAISVLVSAPPEQHRISLIQSEADAAPGSACGCTA